MPAFNSQLGCSLLFPKHWVLIFAWQMIGIFSFLLSFVSSCLSPLTFVSSEDFFRTIRPYIGRVEFKSSSATKMQHKSGSHFTRVLNAASNSIPLRCRRPREIYMET